MSNALITVFGGTGFLGRHTVRALAKAGFRVRVAVRHPNRGFFLPSMGHVGQIALTKCDVRNPDQVADAVHGAVGVVNLTGRRNRKSGTGDGRGFVGPRVGHRRRP